jgi:hypothetical protein
MTKATSWKQVLAIATLIGTVVALSGCSVFISSSDGTSKSAEASHSAAQDVFSLMVGDCEVAGPIDGMFSETTVVDCAEPHQSEVFAASTVPEGEFPGDAVIQKQGNTDCSAEFGSFIGVDLADSIYNVSWYYPTEESWGAGDREILCVVYDRAGTPTTGSLRGVAQ